MFRRHLMTTCALLSALAACDTTETTTSETPSVTTAPLVTTVNAAKELFITDLSVVNDRKYVDYKPGKFESTPDGGWSFGRLIDNLMTDKKPSDQKRSDFVMRWLKSWESPQTVNGQTIAARPLVRDIIIAPWKQRSIGKLGNTAAKCTASATTDLTCKLSFAPGDVPFDLIAIVFRPDLRVIGTGGASTGTSAGQGRFIFALTDGDQNPLPFTVIFEYSIPAGSKDEVAYMAQQVHALGNIAFGPAYNATVQEMTTYFMGRGIASWRQNGSALLQLRTNDVMLAAPGSDPSHPLGVLWELREFVLGADGFFKNDTMKLEPKLSASGSDALSNWVADNEAAIRANNFDVPDTYEGESFLAASSFAPFDFVWNVPGAPEDLRHAFALQTCNGCHVNETGTFFLHAFPMAKGEEATLSAWLANEISPTGARTQEYISLLNTPAPQIKTGKKKDHRN